jgi:general stress protein YciG
MDTHRQREIARKGGRAAHEKGKAHEFTPDEARAAGRKGGEKVSASTWPRLAAAADAAPPNAVDRMGRKGTDHNRKPRSRQVRSRERNQTVSRMAKARKFCLTKNCGEKKAAPPGGLFFSHVRNEQ